MKAPDADSLSLHTCEYEKKSSGKGHCSGAQVSRFEGRRRGRAIAWGISVEIGIVMIFI